MEAMLKEIEEVRAQNRNVSAQTELLEAELQQKQADIATMPRLIRQNEVLKLEIEYLKIKYANKGVIEVKQESEDPEVWPQLMIFSPVFWNNSVWIFPFRYFLPYHFWHILTYDTKITIFVLEQNYKKLNRIWRKKTKIRKRKLFNWLSANILIIQ